MDKLVFDRHDDGKIFASYEHERSGRLDHYAKDSAESEAHFVGRVVRYVTDFADGNQFCVDPLDRQENIADTGEVG
jgi:hypothetical protein